MYMWLQYKLEDARAEGFEEGFAKGRAEGLAKAREERLTEAREEERVKNVAKLADMVSKGLVAASDAAACFDIPEEELLRAVRA